MESLVKRKSDCQSYISKFDNLTAKNSDENKWSLIENKQGLPEDYGEAKKNMTLKITKKRVDVQRNFK